jgi:alkanesulfonate monooxygenase SsuD/methylene tetrahydromethanopterin reductase-like flavin-dependent oxidoreductase (luciferase family)
MPAPRLVMVLTENWTIMSARDLRALVRMAVEAEDAGVDAVMLSDHLVLGASAGAKGRAMNPKEYAAPGNQDPATPWPDSVVLMSGIAAATTRLRIVAGAIPSCSRTSSRRSTCSARGGSSSSPR